MIGYEELLSHRGERVSFSDGEVVLDPSGGIVVSDVFMRNSLYLAEGKITPVVDRELYFGRVYRLRSSDCITLSLEWVKDQTGVDLLPKYFGLSFADFRRNSDCMSEKVEEWGFVKDPDGPLAWYPVEENRNHFGIIQEDKIIHHLPQRYSSIDVVDVSHVKERYSCPQMV
jgi:hypothetical protein